PARHRLDHYEAERLVPVDREEERAGATEQLDLLAVRQLAQVLDPAPQMRADVPLEVGALLGLAALGADAQLEAERPRHLDGAVRALVVAEPTEEGEVVVMSGVEGVEGHVDCVRTDAVPGRLRERALLAGAQRDQ